MVDHPEMGVGINVSQGLFSGRKACGGPSSIVADITVCMQCICIQPFDQKQQNFFCMSVPLVDVLIYLMMKRDDDFLVHSFIW